MTKRPPGVVDQNPSIKRREGTRLGSRLLLEPRKSRTGEPFVAWPGWGLLAQYCWMAVAVTLWWISVYFGANWLTALRSYRVPVHLDAELAIPFVPAFILVYLSMDLIFIPAPFILRSRVELRALAMSVTLVIAVAGICFLLLPAELAYPPADQGHWSAWFTFTRKIVLTYNLVPSLHVAISVVGLAAYCTRCGLTGKFLLLSWAAAIAVSTLLTHEHHILDVGTGLALGLAGHFFIYRPWSTHSPIGRRLPPSRIDDPARSA
jgi:hypothetical protein